LNAYDRSPRLIRAQSSSPKKTAKTKRKAVDTVMDLDDLIPNERLMKRSNRLQQSPSPAPADKKSMSNQVTEDTNMGKMIEFNLPLDEFEDLIEKARKSSIESVVSNEPDDHHFLHPEITNSKRSGRKKSPVIKSSESNSSPSQRRSRR
jgi:hypothetical protein